MINLTWYLSCTVHLTIYILDYLPLKYAAVIVSRMDALCRFSAFLCICNRVEVFRFIVIKNLLQNNNKKARVLSDIRTIAFIKKCHPWILKCIFNVFILDTLKLEYINFNKHCIVLNQWVFKAFNWRGPFWKGNYFFLKVFLDQSRITHSSYFRFFLTRTFYKT